jgi:endonuclease-3
LGHRRGLKIGEILRAIRKMVHGSRDKRATALAELQEKEEGDPFRILIGTILSQRTRDENTSRAVENLFSRYKDVWQLKDADEEEVKRLIRPSGFYNVKARNILRVAGLIAEQHHGRVPSTLEELLELPAVGRKTANCVLVYGFNQPAIPVDTHVHRISNRLGLVETKRPDQTELALTETVPKRYWLELNDLFVRFGQTVCVPVRPRCEICRLTDVCKYYKQVVVPRKAESLRQRQTKLAQKRR